MKSTIDETLKKQDSEAYRDDLTAQMVAKLDYCVSGEKHKWRLMQWQETSESIPLWSAGVMAPVCYERTPVHTTSKMVCYCGAQVDYKSSEFAR